jgi:hypothetical protein
VVKPKKYGIESLKSLTNPGTERLITVWDLLGGSRALCTFGHGKGQMMQHLFVLIAPHNSIAGPSLLKEPTELGEDKALIIRRYGKAPLHGLGGVLTPI